MKNVHLSFNNFYEAITALFDKHAPYQKVKKYPLKLKAKPWITAGIHAEYKKYRNMLSAFTKKSKKCYYGNFLKNNLNDLNNIWKEITNLIQIQ